VTPEEYYDAYHDLEAAADALAAAVEAHSFAFSDDTALAILSALAEYRKIRPQEAK